MHDTLIEPIERGYFREVQNILDRGIVSNFGYQKDLPNRKSPLTFAALHGRIEIMKLLIERGEKVDRPDLHGRTPLSWAAEHCQLKAAQLLLSYGAEVNAEDDEWITPLSWLLYADERNVRHELYDYLVSNGAMKMLDHTLWERLQYPFRARWNWKSYKLDRFLLLFPIMTLPNSYIPCIRSFSGRLY